MKNYIFLKLLVIISLTLLHFEINAQNNIVIKNEGHFVANLDFIPNSEVYTARNNKISNPYFNPFFPQEFTDKNITVKNMVKGATLNMDWWILFGEPVENYNFQWTSSGKYHISEYSGNLNVTITREMVAKYPDLLMRFDAIKPLDVKFSIYWKLSNDAYKNGLHYTFSSSNINHSVLTNIRTGLLFELSGRNPLSVPSIRQEKGMQFIEKKFAQNQHYDLNDNEKKSWISEFKKTDRIFIDKYFVSEIKWPVAEMKAIAELFLKYEKGEKIPSPIEIVNDELSKIHGLTAYNNNDFWGNSYEEEDIERELSHKVTGYFGSGTTSIIEKKTQKVTFSTSNPINRINNNYFILDDRKGGKNDRGIIDYKGNAKRIQNAEKFQYYYISDGYNRRSNVTFTDIPYHVNLNKSWQIIEHEIWLWKENTFIQSINNGSFGEGIPFKMSNSFDEIKNYIVNYKPNHRMTYDYKLYVAKYMVYVIDPKSLAVIKEKTMFTTATY